MPEPTDERFRRFVAANRGASLPLLDDDMDYVRDQMIRKTVAKVATPDAGHEMALIVARSMKGRPAIAAAPDPAPEGPPGWPVRVDITDVALRLPEGTYDLDVAIGGAKVGRLNVTADQYAQIIGEHPEDCCNRCGGPNVPWTAPSPLWNQVMRGGHINGDDQFGGIVCPSCFATLAELAGIADLWRFDATRVKVPLQTVTPSGRVWDAETWLWTEPAGRADA